MAMRVEAAKLRRSTFKEYRVIAGSGAACTNSDESRLSSVELFAAAVGEPIHERNGDRHHHLPLAGGLVYFSRHPVTLARHAARLGPHHTLDVAAGKDLALQDDHARWSVAKRRDLFGNSWIDPFATVVPTSIASVLFSAPLSHLKAAAQDGTPTVIPDAVSVGPDHVKITPTYLHCAVAEEKVSIRAQSIADAMLKGKLPHQEFLALFSVDVPFSSTAAAAHTNIPNCLAGLQLQLLFSLRGAPVIHLAVLPFSATLDTDATFTMHAPAVATPSIPMPHTANHGRSWYPSQPRTYSMVDQRVVEFLKQHPPPADSALRCLELTESQCRRDDIAAFEDHIRFCYFVRYRLGVRCGFKNATVSSAKTLPDGQCLQHQKVQLDLSGLPTKFKDIKGDHPIRATRHTLSVPVHTTENCDFITTWLELRCLVFLHLYTNSEFYFPGQEEQLHRFLNPGALQLSIGNTKISSINTSVDEDALMNYDPIASVAYQPTTVGCGTKSGLDDVTMKLLPMEAVEPLHAAQLGRGELPSSKCNNKQFYMCNEVASCIEKQLSCVVGTESSFMDVASSDGGKGGGDHPPHWLASSALESQLRLSANPEWSHWLLRCITPSPTLRWTPQNHHQWPFYFRFGVWAVHVGICYKSTVGSGEVSHHIPIEVAQHISQYL